MGEKLKKFTKKVRFVKKRAIFLPKEMVIDTKKLIDVMICQYVFIEIY